MTTVHGFELVREQHIPELSTQARLWRHTKTGAQLLSMENKDENKVFSIGFYTPPPSSNGLTHILEHSVLCGSRKFPVKEPFVELIKSSLNTFVNAMTFPDSTWYPAASQNLQDFYNLIEVYLDAVFFPLLQPHILKQEGWHYELESPDAPIVYKGVVFNEMKGNYSSPDGLSREYAQQSLYPDNHYGYDSGGDPVIIPELTYEQFKQFHQTYYHPSNAMVYFYGNDDPTERLRIADDYLSQFDAAPIDRAVPAQPTFAQPRQMTRPYDMDAEEDGESAKKSYVTLNWALPENGDFEQMMALEILQYILVGSTASPLRKALIDSGLGEALTGGGLDNSMKYSWFSTGLKGIASDDAPKVEALIMQTLEGLAHDGIEADMLEAAMNTTEFSLREANTGSYPRGLIYMFSTLSVWPYGKDPIPALSYEGPLSAIKARLAKGERYFEGLIELFLLNNPHRSTVLLHPEAGLGAKLDAEEAARLESVKAALSENNLQALIDDTQKLQELQVTPDTPESLSSIPTLKLSDMERSHKVIPITVSHSGNATLLFHDLPTNGIIYLDLGFDMHVLTPAQLPYLGILKRLLLDMGTQTEDYVKLSQRIGRKIGGLSVSPFTSMKVGGTEGIARLLLRGKATPAQADDLLAIARDVLLTVKLDNRDRFRQIALQEKARLEGGIVPSGHSYAMTRLGAAFNEAAWANEQIGGVEYLFFVRHLLEQIETDWSSVLQNLETVYRKLINRDALLVNVTLDAANYASFEPKLRSFIASLPATSVQIQHWKRDQAATQNEGLVIPSQVNYVAKGANLFELGYEPHGSHMAILNFTSTTWLWERIRVRGGAYGGFNRFNPLSGTFAFASYRDPNLLTTIENYDGTAEFLATLELDPQELERTIIGAVGELDGYQLPDAKGFTSMVDYLTGQTPKMLQQERDELLTTSAADFRRFGELLKAVNDKGRVVVVGSNADIEAANESKGDDWLTVTKVL